MNEVSFRENIKEVLKFLSNIDVAKKANYGNIQKLSYTKFSRDFFEVSRDGNYVQIYRCALENDDYDILLKDGSFFQFSLDQGKNEENIRMAFYPSISVVDYDGFLYEMLGESEQDVGAEYIEDYQQYLIEQEPKSVTPIRYDYNSELYDEIIHSASHIHFGYEENIRIPVNKKIKPLLFSKMIVAFYYYDVWKKKIKNGELDFLYSKSDFEELEKHFFSEKDKRLPFVEIYSYIK